MKEKLREIVLNMSKAKSKTINEYENVYTGIYDDDIEDIVLAVLKASQEPLTWSELLWLFKGVCGEDRLRRILRIMRGKNKIVMLKRYRFMHIDNVREEHLKEIENTRVISVILGMQNE